MGVLLLRLAGAMQSWGTQSRFSVRDTGLEPSKSGVIGLLCAALGKPRAEIAGDEFPTLAELTALRMGVRVNREGAPKVDYHTAGGVHRQGVAYGVVKASGKAGDTVTSQRHYLADADFLVGLESVDEALLRRLDEALQHPRWQIFLGRKSFVPTIPVREPVGVRSETLSELLQTYVSLHMPRFDEGAQLRIVVDADAATATEARIDVPLSFAARRFTVRYVQTGFVSNPAPQKIAMPPGAEENKSRVLIEADS
ncbi:MAG TPA: type I-E CRISPR-associated protein Cas5/CasD [Pyrinomonadaceae bacterium]|jgi:CRISPR system Cascade subunit CasD|nr:type I-E CRISPR-associated protein Cas5/CasD [Pyrinomonadaceae bacterium]